MDAGSEWAVIALIAAVDFWAILLTLRDAFGQGNSSLGRLREEASNLVAGVERGRHSFQTSDPVASTRTHPS